MSPATEWLTREEAAELLHVSGRQIERRAAAGAIRTWRDPQRPERAALYSLEDLQAIRAGRPNRHPVVETALARPAAKGLTPPAVHVPVLDLVPLVERVAELLAPPAAPRPWLSIRAASGYSGLPAAFLRSIAPHLAERGDALNVAAAGRRARWKIRRAALDAPMPGF